MHILAVAFNSAHITSTLTRTVYMLKHQKKIKDMLLQINSTIRYMLVQLCITSKVFSKVTKSLYIYLLQKNAIVWWETWTAVIIFL